MHTLVLFANVSSFYYFNNYPYISIDFYCCLLCLEHSTFLTKYFSIYHHYFSSASIESLSYVYCSAFLFNISFCLFAILLSSVQQASSTCILIGKCNFPVLIDVINQMYQSGGSSLCPNLNVSNNVLWTEHLNVQLTASHVSI